MYNTKNPQNSLTLFPKENESMPNNSYVIMTDSCSDLPSRLVDELELHVIPLSHTIGGKEYLNYPDERDLSFPDFYAMLRKERKSTTSAINTATFISYMEPLLQSGKDVYYLAFSSALSATCSASEIAAAELREKYPDRKIYVTDTLCASLGQGLLVYLTAMEKEKGASIDEARDFAEKTKPHLCHWFTVDDLHHLHSGGRISKTTAVVGSMLNIKPLLHVTDEGKLESVSKVRGVGGALKALLDKVVTDAIRPEEQTIFISHGDCQDRANELANKIKAALPVKDIIINYIGPVIGSHSGPGTLAVFYLGTKR
jgi:DegV family protein with EDD domain